MMDRMKSHVLRFAGALALCSGCNGATADAFNYWGLQAYLVQQEADIVLPAGADLIPDTDTSSFGSRLLFGRHFSRFFALEAGALTYRTAPSRLLDAEGLTVLHLSAQSDVAIDIRAVGTLPVADDFFFKIHAGPRFWNLRTYQIESTGEQPAFSQTQSTQTSTTVGLDIGVAWGRNAAVLLGYEHMSSQPHDGSYVSLGITFRLD